MKARRKIHVSKRDNICLLLVAIILGGVLGLSLFTLKSVAPAADEMVFIRVTQQLPKYDSHSEWWTLMGETHPADEPQFDSQKDSDNEALRAQFDYFYEVPIRQHPPVASYLAYPLVKLLYNEETPKQVYKSVRDLRQFAWAMIAFCVLAVAYIARKKCKTGTALLLALLPLVALPALFTRFGNNWFYNDTFMLVFLVMALSMRGTKYEKFIYIPLALMVGCKIYAIAFLIPFIIENKKTALCSLMLVPYFIQCYFATGDFFFPFTLRLMIPKGSGYITMWYALSNGLKMIWLEVIRIPYFMGITTLPFAFLVLREIKNKNWFLPLLYVISFGVTGLGTTDCEYRLLPAIIIGTLVTVEAVSIYALNKNIVQSSRRRKQ